MRKTPFRCGRCLKEVKYLVKPYWGGEYGAICSACCEKADKVFSNRVEGWPPHPAPQAAAS